MIETFWQDVSLRIKRHSRLLTVNQKCQLPKLPAVIAESGDNNVDQFLDKLDTLNLTKNTVIILLCANSAFHRRASMSEAFALSR